MECGCRVQAFGLYGVVGNLVVTLWVMNDFLECQTSQRVAACAACQCRVLGIARLLIFLSNAVRCEKGKFDEIVRFFEVP
ncbi:MAG: hypothetical protein COB41_08855 [Proteobacteria bacterium]|nr:MAG: hypothetical protein COB41_08855 [Pseudomonadota bacterium]